MTLQFKNIAVAASAFAASVWAQSCEISVGYASAASVVSPVPGLSLTGMGLLAAGIGIAIWRKGRNTNLNRALSIGVISGAVALSTIGGESLVRAAGPYEFINPSGGIVADAAVPYASPASMISISNTSGQRIRITSNGNSSDPGTCLAGSQLAAGDSCTTQAFACKLQKIEVVSEPAVSCDINTQIAAYQTNDDDISQGFLRIYAPVISTQPTFSIPSVPTEITYSVVHTTPIYSASHFLMNNNQLTMVNYTITATAPVGYGFDDALTPTKTWVNTTSCWTQDPANT